MTSGSWFCCLLAEETVLILFIHTFVLTQKCTKSQDLWPFKAAYSNFGEEIEVSGLWARLALSAGCRPMLRILIDSD
jgi:hypothetical protein